MRSSHRKVDSELLRETQQLLQKYFSTQLMISSATYLSEPERRNVILRMTLESSSKSVPASVILKQSLSLKSDSENINAEDERAFARFSRDWAGLAFANNISQSVHNVPRFYGASHKHRFILIEDLGLHHVSLVDSLTTSSPEQAVFALERYMKALGSFHAASFNHTSQFEEILKKINKDAVTVEQELEDHLNDLSKNLSDALKIEKLGLSISEGFKSEVQQVLEAIFLPGPFTVLTHGDIAPDNVFDHQVDKGLQLIDFEWCAVRNALLDGTYLRMSMPTAWCAKTIPENIIKQVEQIYRDELKKTIPQASEDRCYKTAYTQACAFHILHQMATIESCLEIDREWGSGPIPKDSLWDTSNNFLRPRFLSRLQTFIDVSADNNMYPHIRKMASDMLSRVKALWPDARSLDHFPAFYAVRSLQENSKSTTAILMEKGIAKKSDASTCDMPEDLAKKNSDAIEKLTMSTVVICGKSDQVEQIEVTNHSVCKPL